MTFNISVLDTFPDDVDQKRGTVVAIHGFPGTGNDFESLATKLHERGIRLVAPTSLGMFIFTIFIKKSSNLKKIYYIQK